MSSAVSMMPCVFRKVWALTMQKPIGDLGLFIIVSVFSVEAESVDGSDYGG